MEDIVDRLETVKRTFDNALFIGAGDATAQLTPECKVGHVTNVDLSPRRLPPDGIKVVANEDFLPFKPQSFDLIVSVLTLHHANDLIGALAQARLSLKPDGLFIAALFAENTLASLKSALYAAEANHRNALAGRFTPMATIQDLGGALSRAGFSLTSVDIDRVQVSYKNPKRLIEDIRGLGDTNILNGATMPLRREIIDDALMLFSKAGSSEQFDIAFLTGWAPHPDQQKPLAPGSAKASLRDAITDFSEN